MICVVEIITGRFARGGLNNNTKKRHLQVIMVVENKKVKNDDINKGLIISFFDENYFNGFDRDHDVPMVITTTVHNYAIKRVLVD